MKITKAPLSSACNITSFKVPGMMGDEATFTHPVGGNNGVISVTMPKGTDLSALIPTILPSTGATVDPASGVQQNFTGSLTNPVVYIVTAEDGTTTQKYDVKIGNATGSSAKDITGFSVGNMVGDPVFNHTATPATVSAVVKFGTVITSVTPFIQVSPLATFTPAGAQNFAAAPGYVDYVVQAQDGTTKTYRITLTVQTDLNACSLDTFNINGYPCTIVGTKVTVDLPYGANKALLSYNYTYTGGSISYAYAGNPTFTSLVNGQSLNFTNPVTIRVTAKDGVSYIDYTVTVNVLPASSEKQITSFTIPNMIGNTVINHTSRTITVTMPAGTNVTSLVPTITTTFGATVTPASQVAQNFSSPVTYTVKATDGTTTTYSASVVVEGNRTLTHVGTGVKVIGNLYSNASLNVTENSLHASGACTACDSIRAWMALGSVLKVYNVEIVNGYTGSITVGIPVSTSYSGKQLTVLHCNNGVLERTNATVDTSGMISATFSTVSPFAVLNGVYSGSPGDGTDPPKTGDEEIYSSWGALLITVALLLAALFGMHLLNQRRKGLQ